MRVLQLGKFYPIRGGVEKVMKDLTEGLSAKGVECDMLCAWFDKGCRKTILPLNEKGRIIIFPTRFKASGTMIAPGIIGYLRSHATEYDIIHIHHPDPMAGLALRLSGFKGRVILHWHSDILKKKILLASYLPIQRWLVRRAERIVGTTPTYVSQSPWLTKVQDKVTYVPIGIDPVIPDRTKVQTIKSKYFNKKIVFSLGRLVPYKGYSYLIDAARFLPDDYIVLIGGTGPLHDTLESQIKENGLEEKVKLLDRVEDDELPSLYGASSVFVLSSVMKTEAFGIVQIEAMSVGVPVIATKIPGSGTAWVNKDGFSGLNVEPRDSKELAQAIMEVCESEERHLLFSANATINYQSRFTSETMINKIIQIYES